MYIICYIHISHILPSSTSTLPSFIKISIADINQALVDDGLVDKEKIGGSNYFWSFPAKKDRLNQLAHEETLKKIEVLRTNIKEAEARLADAKRGREEDESGERAKKMARRVELRKELATGQAELDKLKQNDPQEIANLEQELQYVSQGAHRWYVLFVLYVCCFDSRERGGAASLRVSLVVSNLMHLNLCHVSLPTLGRTTSL